jgi:PAS domain S-box-containing protein
MHLPRIARVNYPLRVASFGWCALVVGILLYERGAGPLAWSLLALTFLVYPHVALLVTGVAENGQRAELVNLYLDAVLLGAWVAALGFPLWILYGGLFAAILNNTVMRGLRGALGAAASFAGGALAWSVPMGFVLQPEAGFLVAGLCLVGSLGYATSVGIVVANQNKRLRRTREALRASEQNYRLITEHAADLVAMVDRDGRWLYSSPSYARFLAPEDLARGADAFARLHIEDQGRARGSVEMALRDGGTRRVRVRLYTSSGDVRRLEMLVHAVKDAENPGAVLASRDVTELRDREEQLEVAAHAFEQMAEGMVITNAAGRILSTNRAFSRITGYASEEVVGRPEREIRSSMQQPSFYDDLYAEVLRSGYWSGTSWCQRRDGTLYREWRSVSAVRDAEERITHFVSLFREMDSRGADSAGGSPIPPAARSA